MDDAVADPRSPEHPTPPRRLGDGSVVALVGAVLSGVGSLYACTHSVLVILIAAVMSVLLTAMLLRARR